MYGVELHKAKVTTRHCQRHVCLNAICFQDNTGKDIQIGVTHIGLVVFQNNIKINTFSWSKIMKISFKRKQFFIQLRREPVRKIQTSIVKMVALIGFVFSPNPTILYQGLIWRHIVHRKRCGKLVQNTTPSSGCIRRNRGESFRFLWVPSLRIPEERNFRLFPISSRKLGWKRSLSDLPASKL